MPLFGCGEGTELDGKGWLLATLQLLGPRGKRFSWAEGSRVLAAILVLISTGVSMGTYLTDFVFHTPIFGCINYISLL